MIHLSETTIINTLYNRTESHTQVSVAFWYAQLINSDSGHSVIADINSRIIQRWSVSGLNRVKEIAWAISGELLTMGSAEQSMGVKS